MPPPGRTRSGSSRSTGTSGSTPAPGTCPRPTSPGCTWPSTPPPSATPSHLPPHQVRPDARLLDEERKLLAHAIGDGRLQRRVHPRPDAAPALQPGRRRSPRPAPGGLHPLRRPVSYTHLTLPTKRIV